MDKGWQRRLGVSLSVLWLVAWIGGYLQDASKTWRDAAFGLTFFAVLPILFCWKVKARPAY